MKRGVRIAVTAGAIALAVPAVVPQALAFPYHATAHGSEFWSERPLPQAELDAVATRAAALVARSPIARPAEPRHVFLTQGGWRWNWLALGTRTSIGLTRPLVEAVVVNRSDLAGDRVAIAATLGGRRTLSGVIAHETCHGMTRRHFGLTVALKPTWLTEGYCDYVGQESSLADANAARLRASDPDHPALPYYDGRRRVARTLAANGGNVDALFAAN